MTNDNAPRSIAETIEQFGRMLTIEDLALLLALSPKTLYARSKRGSIPVTRIGSSIRFDPYLTAEWVRERTA